MSEKDRYIDLARHRLGLTSWVPTWPPGADLDVGWVVHAKDWELRKSYNAEDRLNIPLKREPRDRKPDQYNYDSDGAVEITAKASGKTDKAFQGVAEGEAAFRMTWRKSDAIAVLLRDIVEVRLRDEPAIAQAMLASHRSGADLHMEFGDIVITQLRIAGYGFVYSGQSTDAEVVLATDASVGSGRASVGQINGRLAVRHERSTGLSALSQDGMAVGWRGLALMPGGVWKVKAVVDEVPGIEAASGPRFDRELLLPLEEEATTEPPLR